MFDEELENDGTELKQQQTLSLRKAAPGESSDTYGLLTLLICHLRFVFQPTGGDHYLVVEQNEGDGA